MLQACPMYAYVPARDLARARLKARGIQFEQYPDIPGDRC